MPKGVYTSKNRYKFPKGNEFVFKKCHKPKNGFKKGDTPFNKGKKFVHSGSFKKGRIVSKEIREKISLSNKGKGGMEGDKNPRWKGGITSENQKVKNSIEYKLWRKSVFERDSFTCQKYKSKGGYLISHHINNFADFTELRLAIDNGITLSKKAHDEFHKLYGRRNNTKEQLINFLSL
jgi:hypothetical protein